VINVGEFSTLDVEIPTADKLLIVDEFSIVDEFQSLINSWYILDFW
jgi:hypothetical protein